MVDAHVTDKLELRWVPVADERGRTHMEARWTVADAIPAAAVGPAPHAA